MKQQCPDCKRFMRHAGSVPADDAALTRMRQKLPNMVGIHWECKRCGEEFTIFECSVVLSEKAA